MCCPVSPSRLAADSLSSTPSDPLDTQYHAGFNELGYMTICRELPIAAVNDVTYRHTFRHACHQFGTNQSAATEDCFTHGW